MRPDPCSRTYRGNRDPQPKRPGFGGPRQPFKNRCCPQDTIPGADPAETGFGSRFRSLALHREGSSPPLAAPNRAAKHPRACRQALRTRVPCHIRPRAPTGGGVGRMRPPRPQRGQTGKERVRTRERCDPHRRCHKEAVAEWKGLEPPAPGGGKQEKKWVREETPVSFTDGAIPVDMAEWMGLEPPPPEGANRKEEGSNEGTVRPAPSVPQRGCGGVEGIRTLETASNRLLP